MAQSLSELLAELDTLSSTGAVEKKKSFAELVAMKKQVSELPVAATDAIERMRAKKILNELLAQVKSGQ